MNKFEKYLEVQFLKDHPETLDDDISDAMWHWLERKDIEEIIEYGNKAMEK